MLDKIYKHVKRYNMFSEGSTVVCGLSGGADSVCLLLCLCSLSEKLGINVEAVHVNHCLRGSESDRDQEFCRQLCERENVPFTAVSCDVNTYAKENSLSTEEAARILRYRAFADNSHGKLLATAHNANDNLETAIFNLARGTALKGIAGIPPVRDNIVRPLLTVSRQEIEEYLRSLGQVWVTDSTNLSDDYTRNKIRHQVLPVLEGLNSSLIATSVNTFEVLRSEDQLIEDITREALEKCRNGNRLTGLSELHPVIRRRCIARLLSDNGLSYSYARLEETDSIAVNGGKINISGELFLVSDGTTLSLEKIPPKSGEELLSAELRIGKNSIFSGITLNCELVECDSMKKFSYVNKKLTFYMLDYDKIIGRAVLRNRRFGDRIQLRGRNFSSSVKKLINETVPKELRDTLHFIEDEEGTLFAEYIGVAQRVAPDGNTKRLLKITIDR